MKFVLCARDDDDDGFLIAATRGYLPVCDRMR